MKSGKKIKVLFITAMFMASCQTLLAQATYSITINVENLRNSSGVVQFALYNKEGSIPDKKFEHYYKIGTAAINKQQATFTFQDLPTGRYAVNILHDENENGKIDMGLILPKEGIGFSNYEKIGPRNQPNFTKASFEFHDNKNITIKIIYL